MDNKKDFVRTRICQYAKKQGCINLDGEVNKSLAYNNFGIKTEDWLETAKAIRK